MRDTAKVLVSGIERSSAARRNYYVMPCLGCVLQIPSFLKLYNSSLNGSEITV